jgi:hypothetical protein
MIEFTQYAQLQMEDRKITREEVIGTLDLPDQIIFGKKSRKIAQKRLERGEEIGLLRVIFEEKLDAKVVVTVYWTSKKEKYWRAK